jgi:hypothetical protein
MSDLFADAAASLTDLLKEMKGVKPTFKEPLLTQPKPERVPVKHVKKEETPKKESPVMTYVRSLPGGPYKTAIEVANELNISVQAVRKYAKNPELSAPSFTAPFGRISIHLYTDEDVKEIHDYLAARRQVVPTKKTL